MVIRIVAAVLVGTAPLIGGCGANPAPAPPPAPTTSDEDQIRDVLTAQGDAFKVWDVDKVASLTCAKYRDQAGSFAEAVPPMEMFPADAAASMGPEEFARVIGDQFTGASDESLLAVADAVIRQDQAAYATAMEDVVKQSSAIRLDKVDNIVVNGDTATADTTVTFSMAAQPPQTEVTKAELVKEDGQWKDCTPPNQS